MISSDVHIIEKGGRDTTIKELLYVYCISLASYLCYFFSLNLIKQER